MNLLPDTEKEALKKDLTIRFITTVLSVSATSFLVGLVMLLPSYFLTTGYFSDKYSPGIKDDELTKNILNLPEEINSKSIFLQSNTSSLPAIDIFSKIISQLPNGVTLNSIAFLRNQNYEGKVGITVSVFGIATTRDSLVSFSTRLTQSDSFSVVDVPVSSLTKNRDLPFSVNIFIEN